MITFPARTVPQDRYPTAEAYRAVWQRIKALRDPGRVNFWGQQIGYRFPKRAMV